MDLNRNIILEIDLDTGHISTTANNYFYNTDRNIAYFYIKLYTTNPAGEKLYISEANSSQYKVYIMAIKPKTLTPVKLLGERVTNSDIDNNIAYKIVIPNELMKQQGSVYCEGQVIYNNQELTTDCFSFKVNPDKLTEYNLTLITDPDLPVLQDLINQIKHDVRGIDDSKISDNTVWSSEYTNTKLNNFNSQIKEKVNLEDIRHKQKVISSQEGIWDDACTVAIMANTSKEKKADICGFINSAHTSTYKDRDSVSLYVRADGRNATLIKSNCSFTQTNVTVLDSTDLDKIKENMVIDTTDGYSSLIDRVEGMVIYIKEGWYKSNVKGTPANGSSVIINQTTKIWGMNCNTVLEQNMATNNSACAEFGIINNKPNGLAGGLDVVNLGLYNAQYGFYARASNRDRSIERAFLAKDSIVALSNRTNTSTDVLVQSTSVNDKFDINKNIKMLNDGTLSKLKLNTETITTDSSATLKDDTGVALINPSSASVIINLPNNSVKPNSFLFIINVGPVNVTLSSANKIYGTESQAITHVLRAYSAMVIFNTGSNYYVTSTSSTVFDLVLKTNNGWDLGSNTNRMNRAYFNNIVALKPFNEGSIPTSDVPKGAMAYHNGTNKPIWFNGTYWHYADGTQV